MRSYSGRVSLLLIAAVASPALGWGFDGHRRLAGHLHDAIPADHCMRQWLFSVDQSAGFQNLATEPDTWRLQTLNGNPNPAYDAAEWSRHYLEIDRLNPPSSYPREWDAVVARFGGAADNNGQVPWRVEEYYGKLVTALRAKDSAAAATVAAHFSHYVTDAASILHDTRNFDPKLSATDTVGLHARWESDMLQSSSRINGITSDTALYLGTLGTVRPRDDTFSLVLTGNAQLAALIAADQRSNGDLAKLFTETRELTARRWADSLVLYGSLAVAAWHEAGKPQLTGMQAGCSAFAPTTPLVFKGHPPTVVTDAGVPDAGKPTPPDAGAADAGGEPSEPDAGIPYVEPGTNNSSTPGTCGGTTAATFLPFLFVGLVAARRRR